MIEDINAVFDEQMVDPEAIGTELYQWEWKKEEEENMRQ